MMTNGGAIAASSGLASFDELMANSVSELGTAFLEALVDQGAGAK